MFVSLSVSLFAEKWSSLAISFNANLRADESGFHHVPRAHAGAPAGTVHGQEIEFGFRGILDRST